MLVNGVLSLLNNWVSNLRSSRILLSAVKSQTLSLKAIAFNSQILAFAES